MTPVKDIPVIFGKKGRTTIPLPIRKRLGWQAGDTICFRQKGNAVMITRAHAKKKPKPKWFMLVIGGNGDG